MSTFAFNSITGGFSLQIDSQPVLNFTNEDVTAEYQAGPYVHVQVGRQAWLIKPTDTITIDGEAAPGTLSDLETALNTLFSSGSSSGGSGGSGGGTILQSPDSTLWQVGVNDAGALQTTQVESGTPGTLHLFSPDNTQWNVTVNNSGALITTAI